MHFEDERRQIKYEIDHSENFDTGKKKKILST